MKNTFKQCILITQMDPLSRLIKYETKYVNAKKDEESKITVSESVYSPSKGDKIWFYPGCDIPRFKVKQFCIKTGVSVVKNKDRSNVRFIGPDTLNTMIHQLWYYEMTKANFLQWFDTVMCNAYEELKDIIIKSEHSSIYLSSHVASQFNNKELFASKTLGSNARSYESNIFAQSEDNYKLLCTIFDDTQIRFQNDLLSLLNTGTVMDEQMYQDIHRLFESTDKENTKLAMEAMANCDFQQSAVYLLMLIGKYGQKIQNSGNIHHVNFKSLVKYFQIKDIQSIDVDDMIDCLRYQKLLSIGNLNRLMPMALEYMQENGNMKNMTITNISLSADAEKAVSENILDNPVSVSLNQIPNQEPEADQSTSPEVPAQETV